mmetsp:Transcript_19588/g.60569  ORF Transcript_19588/g.60569 Transcript_19588/m.60569 type:complete len:240 (-) Transcript_19588:1280-1999(-)
MRSSLATLGGRARRAAAVWSTGKARAAASSRLSRSPCHSPRQASAVWSAAASASLSPSSRTRSTSRPLRVDDRNASTTSCDATSGASRSTRYDRMPATRNTHVFFSSAPPHRFVSLRRRRRRSSSSSSSRTSARSAANAVCSSSPLAVVVASRKSDDAVEDVEFFLEDVDDDDADTAAVEGGCSRVGSSTMRFASSTATRLTVSCAAQRTPRTVARLPDWTTVTLTSTGWSLSASAGTA